jgi:hypothetical protein
MFQAIRKLLNRDKKPCSHGFTENEVIGAWHNKTLPRCLWCSEAVNVREEKSDDGNEELHASPNT